MGFLKSLLNAVTGTGQFRAPQSALSRGRMKRASGSTVKELDLLPKPAVYRIVDKATAKPKYVGQTDNLRQRMGQHKAGGTLNLKKDAVEYREARDGATKDDLCHTEVKHIEKHQPPGNTYRGGNGKR